MFPLTGAAAFQHNVCGQHTRLNRPIGYLLQYIVVLHAEQRRRASDVPQAEHSMSLYKITSVFMDPLVFSFALFPGKDPDYFDYYRDSTLRFVQTMAKTFPGSRFVAHVTDSVPERDTRALVAAASGAMTIKRYAFPKKRGVYWLVSAMRLRTLWEHEGRETVVVADIHDDTRIQVKQVLSLTFRGFSLRSRSAVGLFAVK